MSKCHKADHATIVELRDAYEEVVAERERARDLAAHLEAELSRAQATAVQALHMAADHGAEDCDDDCHEDMGALWARIEAS